VALAEAEREGILAAHLRRYVRLVRFEDGRIEFSPAEGAPADLAHQLEGRLRQWTGKRWWVTIGAAEAAPTLMEQAAEAEALRRARAAADPLVAAALQAFPGAAITEIRPRTSPSDPGDGGP
jgi:DNA polymerase-3 subunit gamma/tau